MSTPERLYDSLNTYEDMKNLLGREIESLYIEFKQTIDEPLRQGHNADNFSRALSGFANSAGGCLIWGLEEEHGIATILRPFPDFRKFEADANDLAGQWVIPAIDGLMVKCIESEDEPGKGFVLMLVPQSDKTPHINQRTHRYYYRSGSSFLRMEHYQLEDMFGRRPKPVLDCFVTMENHQHDAQGKVFLVTVFAINNGRSSAHYPACKVRFNKGIRLDNDQKHKIKVSFDNGFFAFEEYEAVIHPEMQFEIAKFIFDPQGENQIELSITIYSENMQPLKYKKICLFENKYPVDTTLKLPAVIGTKYAHKHLDQEYLENKQSQQLE